MDRTEYWKGTFGDKYTERNSDLGLVENNKWFFMRSLKKAHQVNSFLELGSNVGLNIRALKELYKKASFSAIEVNKVAFHSLMRIPGINASNQSLLDDFQFKADLVFTKGVLIHIFPDLLERAYEQIYNASNKYILIAEYYNPTPTTVHYRGHDDMLFKRDFAGEMLDLYPDLSLIDYGFIYHQAVFPQDDLSWFLLQKRSDVSEESRVDTPDGNSTDAHSEQMGEAPAPEEKEIQDLS